MSILEWKVILKIQHTLLIAIKCFNGYFFFRMIKAAGGLGKRTWPKCWQKPPSVAVWIVHTCIYKHIVAKLCLHTGIQSQPAAGKTSANYSPRAAFAAQCSMLFETVCLEFVKFQVSLFEVFSHYPIAPTCFPQAFAQNNDSSLHVVLTFQKLYWHIF